MILTLEVTGEQAAKLGKESRKIFRNAGGTIGRSPDNAWMLPDPYVSSRHAVVRFIDGMFYIEDDQSRNGVFINSGTNRLLPGQRHQLRTGDLILIEPFEIRVSVSAASALSAAPPYEDPFGPAHTTSSQVHADPQVGALEPFVGDDPFAVPRVDAPPLVKPMGPPDVDLTGANQDPVDPLAVLPDLDRPAPRFSSADKLANPEPWVEPYRPPKTVDPPTPVPQQERRTIPPNYNPLTSDSGVHRSVGSPRVSSPNWQPDPARPQPIEPVRPRVAPPAPPPRSDVHKTRGPEPAQSHAGRDVEAQATLQDVLAGAGFKDVRVTPELARDFGRIMRAVVAGVMDILQARQDTKEEFRIGHTMLKPVANNPLKFSANVDDALHNLFVKRNPAFMEPVEAFQSAFDDLRNHQLAMLEGLRVAFTAMLREFDPDRLEEEFDRQVKKGALLPMPAKLRYWELYRDKIHDMTKDPDATFRALFGNEFADAYKEQLKQLQTHRRSGQS